MSFLPDDNRSGILAGIYLVNAVVAPLTVFYAVRQIPYSIFHIPRPTSYIPRPMFDNPSPISLHCRKAWSTTVH